MVCVGGVMGRQTNVTRHIVSLSLLILTFAGGTLYLETTPVWWWFWLNPRETTKFVSWIRSSRDEQGEMTVSSSWQTWSIWENDFDPASSDRHLVERTEWNAPQQMVLIGGFILDNEATSSKEREQTRKQSKWENKLVLLARNHHDTVWNRQHKPSSWMSSEGDFVVITVLRIFWIPWLSQVLSSFLEFASTRRNDWKIMKKGFAGQFKVDAKAVRTQSHSGRITLWMNKSWLFCSQR